MTETGPASVSFECAKCGTKIVWPDDADGATEISCTSCDEHIGTYGDLRDTAREAVLKRALGSTKDVG